jgi:Leucine-rich repeat (LRR) protein
MLSDIKGISTHEQATTFESLNLAQNYLQILPATALTALLRLRRLNLAHNQLEDVPSLSDLTSLEELDLSHNQLTALEGAWLTQLTSLRHLDVSSNQLPVAPEFVTRLSSVNLANNAFNIQ